jgi:mRNA-degrading endonuclease RelE of RelBE toxin-antitoxin system
MTWQVKYAKTFYRELAKVPEKTRKQVEDFVFGESVKNNPFETGKVERLKGYDEYIKSALVCIAWVYGLIRLKKW